MPVYHIQAWGWRLSDAASRTSNKRRSIPNCVSIVVGYQRAPQPISHILTTSTFLSFCFCFLEARRKSRKQLCRAYGAVLGRKRARAAFGVAAATAARKCRSTAATAAYESLPFLSFLVTAWDFCRERDETKAVSWTENFDEVFRSFPTLIPSPNGHQKPHTPLDTPRVAAASKKTPLCDFSHHHGPTAKGHHP